MQRAPDLVPEMEVETSATIGARNIPRPGVGNPVAGHLCLEAQADAKRAWSPTLPSPRPPTSKNGQVPTPLHWTLRDGKKGTVVRQSKTGQTEGSP